MVRKFYDSGAEIQQMFVNQDVVLAHAWNGPISKLIMDGLPVAMTIPKEGSYGFVYTFNIPKNAPNADNAYTLLDSLLARPEIVLSREKLMEAAYGPGTYVSDRTIDSHVRNIRQKFAQAGCELVIATVHGVGFKLGDVA